MRAICRHDLFERCSSLYTSLVQHFVYLCFFVLLADKANNNSHTKPSSCGRFQVICRHDLFERCNECSNDFLHTSDIVVRYVISYYRRLARMGLRLTHVKPRAACVLFLCSLCCNAHKRTFATEQPKPTSYVSKTPLLFLAKSNHGPRSSI